MKRKGGDENGIVVKNLDTINTSVMGKYNKCEDSCTCDPNFNHLRVSIAFPKQRVKIRNKDTTFVQITIHQEKIAIFRDALLHMGEATVYQAAAESQSRFNNEFRRGVDALVTGCRSKHVRKKQHFP